MERNEPDQKKIFLDAYDTYADAIFRYCLYQTSNRNKALDLLQETFIRTWEYMQNGKQIDDMKPFLYRVAKNAIIDGRRKKSESSLDVMLEAGFDVSDASDIDEQVAVSFEYNEVIQAMEELDDTYREILLLRFVEQLSIEEIAEATGEKKNNVSVRIHRGLEKLKRILEQYETE